MGAINHGLMMGVIRPTGKIYRTVIPAPLRKGIRNAGYNLRYPARVINNMLQGEWKGAGDESLRFLANSTLGIGGLFDVATGMDIGASDEDFGQTFGHWGWQPNVYFMVPLMGPSNDRDIPGAILDTLAYPLTWLYPPAAYGVAYNNLTDAVNPYEVFVTTQSDPYDLTKYVWTFTRRVQVVDFDYSEAERDDATLQTLQALFLTFKDPKFPARRKTRSIRLETSGERLRYTYWLQRKPAPIVFINPGLGAHRRSNSVTALAEMVYNRGFSVVSISSAYNIEFMEKGASTSLPGNTLKDIQDVHGAITEIYNRLDRKYSGRFQEKILMGYSMGAFHTLFIAGNEHLQDESRVRFDRYLALDCPVDLLYGLTRLDAFYNAPLRWSEEERLDKIENLLLKVVQLADGDLTPEIPLPFNSIESQYLIGLAFRFTLRDIIFSSQYRHDLGVLQEPLKRLKRRHAYAEILQYSYTEYFRQFVKAAYQSQGVDFSDINQVFQIASLRSLESELRDHPNIRVYVNKNDFLLRQEDVEWYEQTLGPDRFHSFEEGGHLGNLYKPEVQDLIMTALEDLRPEFAIEQADRGAAENAP